MNYMEDNDSWSLLYARLEGFVLVDPKICRITLERGVVTNTDA